MLIVNALRYAEHSRAGHYIAGRTNHRFVRYITASTTCKIVVRHWRLEPSTTLITDFTCAFPATGLARLPQCQSGLWKGMAGSIVKTGLIANGQQIPLPPGFNPNQCTWSVSNSENPHGWKPNYFAGSVAKVDKNRMVLCGFYDEYNFLAGSHRTDLSGKCSYVISCQ